MSEWTAERLDALPEGILIEWDKYTHIWAALRRKDGWTWLGSDRLKVDRFSEKPGMCSSEMIASETRRSSIRVVSVPIDALLGDEAIEAARATVPVTSLEAENVIRAAASYLTGEASS